ncbi:DNA (cytosine-5-)-methyltransferase [Campylobacter jejuni]|nr:DNA (cytosine-5-)-methyltransferase [Campylobacter jejuni]EKB5832225.1 DNA (cytosine-5-)-methyltransferase [Campylobacter jejuni]
MKINHLDLFSGIGGFALGLKMADEKVFNTLAFCEIEPYCQKLLKQNFDEKAIFNDVKQINEENIKDEIDLITAGFPCQDLSIAGSKKGLQGERSSLFYEVIRIAKFTKAKFILLKIAPNLFGEMILEKNLLKEFKQSGMIVGGNYYVLNPLDIHTKENELMLFVGIKNILLPTPLASDAFCMKNFTISTQMKSHKNHQKRLYPYIASIGGEDVKKILSLIVKIYEEMMGFPAQWTQLKG